jgi:hypothetical protein
MFNTYYGLNCPLPIVGEMVKIREFLQNVPTHSVDILSKVVTANLQFQISNHEWARKIFNRLLTTFRRVGTTFNTFAKRAAPDA